MKRIVSILVLLMLGCNIFTVSAQTEDLFYHDSSNSKLIEDIKKLDSQFIKFTKRYLEKYYLSAGETVDESKISYDITKIHTTYEWEFEDVSAFLRAEDKSDFLDHLDVEYYTMPVYYDGVLLDDYAFSFKYVSGENYLHPTYFAAPLSQKLWRKNYVRKSSVQQMLNELTVDEYEIVHTANTCPYGFFFIFAKKEDQYFAIYGKQSDSHGMEATEFVEKAEPELVTKRVLTADEVDQLLSHYDEYLKTIPAGSNDQIGGGDQATDEDMTNDPQESTAEEAVTPPSVSAENEKSQEVDEVQSPKDNSWLWIIGGAVVLVGGVLTVVLIRKKKKTR